MGESLENSVHGRLALEKALLHMVALDSVEQKKMYLRADAVGAAPIPGDGSYPGALTVKKSRLGAEVVCHARLPYPYLLTGMVTCYKPTDCV